jgi:hypothetical protein
MMDFLHGVVGFMWGIVIFGGPWIVAIYLVNRLFASLRILNQSVIDLQKRVKELEGKKE